MPAAASTSRSARPGATTTTSTSTCSSTIGAGVADDPDASDTIIGGPVNTFRFDYDMFLTPASGVAATYGSSTFVFDLAGDDRRHLLPAGFDGLQYIASNPDLIAAFGANRAAGERIISNFGQGEGRDVDSFSETKYLPELCRSARRVRQQRATRHAALHHQRPGRRADDDAASPDQINGPAVYRLTQDLISAFGLNAVGRSQHYVNFGQSEGRALDTFDETQYLANYCGSADGVREQYGSGDRPLHPVRLRRGPQRLHRLDAAVSRAWQGSLPPRRSVWSHATVRHVERPATFRRT